MRLQGAPAIAGLSGQAGLQMTVAPASSLAQLPHDSFKAGGPPPGRTPIGQAVNQAVAKADSGSVPRNLVFSSGSVTGVYLNSPHHDVIDDVIKDLGQAQHEMRIQTYVFDPSTGPAQRLIAAMAAKQKADPSFKFVVVVNGGTPFSHAARDALAKAGVNADFAEVHRFPCRDIDHAKMFVLDGTTMIVGGANIQNHAEQDDLIKFEGPVADAGLADVADGWKGAYARYQIQDGKILPGPDAVPPVTRGPMPPQDSAVPLTYLSKRGMNFTLFRDPYANDADQAMLAAIGAARDTIRIESPNATPSAAWKALADAAQRGVKVQMIMPKNFNQHFSVLDGANNDMFIKQFWAQLPEPARSNFEMRWFSENGQTTASNHTKYLSVDGQWAYVGSENLDKEALVYSREAGVGIDDPAQTQRLDSQIFEANWNNALPIDPQKFKLNWWEKGLDFVLPRFHL